MNNTDPTSFESILAGVAKLRKEKSGADTTGSQSLEIDASKLQQQEPQTSRRINSNQVINAFNQQKPEEWTDSKATDDYNRKRPFRSTRPGKTHQLEICIFNRN
ncbi:ssDNA endonuclease and repair protein rad10 [Saccharomyces cerevisiae]|nr:ssDNA endonuclease and repair protein rad10 [Saccharomyces cerevisiae]